LNWIQIQLKTIGMQIGGKCIKYLLVNMLLKKPINSQIWKDLGFHAFSLGEWANKFQFGIVQCMTTWGT
jgi:hypothetical protein